MRPASMRSMSRMSFTNSASQPGAPNLPDADRAEILDDVQAQVAELSTLVGDLVELARDDRPQVVHETLELTDVVERALERARRRAGDVEFVTNLVPWTLVGDSTAIERAVLNLLDNAAKWSPPGGRVRVQMRPLDDWSVLLEVADSGPGIAPEFRARLFGKFEQADREHGGTGLGLAISKALVERMQGRIGCDSELARGSTFWVELPKA